jgi:hypothetical protein
MRRPNEPESLEFRKSLFQDRRLFQAEGATTVYCLLAFMSNDAGYVSTSITELMEDTGAGRQLLEEARSHLVDLELIAPEPNDVDASDSELRFRLRVGIDYRKLDEGGEQ